MPPPFLGLGGNEVAWNIGILTCESLERKCFSLASFMVPSGGTSGRFTEVMIV